MPFAVPITQPPRSTLTDEYSVSETWARAKRRRRAGPRQIFRQRRNSPPTELRVAGSGIP